MSGNSKKRGKNFGSSSKGFATSFGDVTLADYANSSLSLGKGRLKKAQANFEVVCGVKHLKIEDKEWDEKLGDLDFVKEEDDDGEEVMVMKKTSRQKKTLSETLADKSTAGGRSYSLDVWHLIARHIRPEDVSIFAAICRDSWCVVNSATFWFGLYKRYYKNVPNLPVRLQPECMVRPHGLKACVIRALFYMYPPLATRVDGPSVGTPYDLKNRQCISLWQERHSNKWRLSFKLRRKNCLQNQCRGGKQNLLDILGDIFANPDDGCTILQVVATERMPILPTVMGLTLHSISMSLDTTMVHMHVQLVFGSGRICNGRLDPTGTVSLSIKTVTQIYVLDWWHPRYPHHNTSIVCREEV